MLTISNNLRNRTIGNQVLTLGTCIKIVLKNGKKLGFTTHTSNVRFIEEPELIYYSKGFTPTAISKNNEMSVDNADGQMIIDNTNVLQSDLESGIYNNAYYELWDFDWTLKTNGYYSYNDRLRDINGTIGEVKRDKLQYTTEYRSLAQYLATTIIDLYKASCNANFGDARCGKDLSTLTFTDSVGAVIKSNEFIVNTLTQVDNFYNNGIVEFTSGDNIGKKYKIKSWINSTKTIILQMPMNYQLQVGDTAIFVAGCNKDKTDCKFFGNYVNYRGFMEIPGLDFISTGGGTKINY